MTKPARGHSAPFWIVDKKGIIQVGMDSDASPRTWSPMSER